MLCNGIYTTAPNIDEREMFIGCMGMSMDANVRASGDYVSTAQPGWNKSSNITDRSEYEVKIHHIDSA